MQQLRKSDESNNSQSLPQAQAPLPNLTPAFPKKSNTTPSAYSTSASASSTPRVSSMLQLEGVTSSVSPPSSLAHNRNAHLLLSSSDSHTPPQLWTTLDSSKNGDNSLVSPVGTRDERLPAFNAGPVPASQPGTATRSAKSVQPVNVQSHGHGRATSSTAVIPPKKLSAETISKSTSTRKGLFDGVVITSRSPHTQKPTAPLSSVSSPSSHPPTTSIKTPSSLLDALQRTFDANTFTALPPIQQDDNTLSAPVTDVETTTDDERNRAAPQTRLASPKRRSKRQQVSQHGRLSDKPEGLVGLPQSKKHTKAVPYDSIPTVVDAALETRLAPIQWGSTTTEREDPGRAREWGVFGEGMSDVSVDPDEWSKQEKIHQCAQQTCILPRCPPRPTPSSSIAMSTAPLELASTLSPYVSMGDRFRQRLYQIFGEDATVQTGRVARPRANYDFTYHALPSTQPPSRSPSGSYVSKKDGKDYDSPADDASSSVARVEVSTTAIPPHERTTTPPPSSTTPPLSSTTPPLSSTTPPLSSTTPLLSSTNPSVPTPLRPLKREASEEPDSRQNHDRDRESDINIVTTHNMPARKKPRLYINEEQVQGWVTGIQRLIKGKIRLDEEVCCPELHELTGLIPSKSI
ncbi:hypothetical protein ID866_6454 [Astraeus odoratus]|nr:hypothetical protein ID866_6454 [Astraeus odoratus]